MLRPLHARPRPWILALAVALAAPFAAAQPAIPAYCADPLGYCEGSMSEACLNPFNNDTSIDCDAEFIEIDRCADNVEKICAMAANRTTTQTPPQTATPAVTPPPVLTTAYVPENQSRVALVIGNSNYNNGLAPLRNPVNDAALMIDTLRDAGFEVIEGLDLDFKQMKRKISDFGQQLSAAPNRKVGLFYFAGHGVQVDGVNYLLPVDANINSEADIEIEGVPANTALVQMGQAGAAVNMLFLDACRDNPFENAFNRSSATRGLARMGGPAGTLISYATAPGDVAEDGIGANSPFTTALAEMIPVPDVEVEAAMKRMRKSVADQTQNRQNPWTTSSMTGEFYFLRQR
ncbi:MAG: caspase family protein [Rhodobacteraceae bacterium]|nr:caspase family protein [Paracoccaceae bacterium]